MDSEKQHLTETYLDSEDSGDTLWTSELCQEKHMSRTELEARRVAKRKLLMACVVSLVFMTGEVIGGYAAHSLAIMTDAAHLLTDFSSILISIFSLLVSSRLQTETMTFGWLRAEVLGMFVSVTSVWAVTILLIFSATQRILEGDYDIDSQLMLITSGCAVGVNIVMVLILHQSGAPHGPRTPTNRLQEDHNSGSVKAAFIHVLGDLLQSVGVLLAATIIHFWTHRPVKNLVAHLCLLIIFGLAEVFQPEYKLADPICTFLFSVVVIGTTLPITKDVFRVLMEGSPRGISSTFVRELLLSVGGVSSVSSLKMWSLNMNHHLLTAHLLTDKDADSQLILRKATKLLRSKFSFSSITIQVEHISAVP